MLLDGFSMFKFKRILVDVVFFLLLVLICLCFKDSQYFILCFKRVFNDGKTESF